MKRLFLSIAVSLLTLTVSFAQSCFDSRHIVCSFGVVSDVHIDSPDGAPATKFRSALQQLKDRAALDDSDGLDAVLVAGDLVNTPWKSEEFYSQVDYFKSCYETVLNPEETPLIYTPGNHDTYRWWTPETVSQAKNISSRLGTEYFLTDIDNEARERMECRHCIVGEYHILSLVPIGARPVTYPSEALEWLDRQLSDITSEDSSRYVLLITHPMIYDTVYGSMLGDYWATSALSGILEKYPQVVTFSGHLHFPLNDPRSIWQGRFTALGCGSVRYMAIEDGQYEDMRSKTVMKDCDEFSQGLLVQFDRKGNMRVTRMDFYHKGAIGKPWTVQYPETDGSHLLTYSFPGRRAVNRPPHLGSIRIVNGLHDGSSSVGIRFHKAYDDEFVHHYVIDVTSSDTLVVRKKLLADFYKHCNPLQMKKVWTVDLGQLKPGTYKVSVVAFDSWGSESNTVYRTFKISGNE